MAVKVRFYGTENTLSDDKYVEVFANSEEEVTIKIKHDNPLIKHYYVSLDKETAIRLSRELRKQIALIL